MPSPKFPPPSAGRLITNLNKKRKAEQEDGQVKRMKLINQTGNIAYDSAVVVAFKRVDWQQEHQPAEKRSLQSPPCSPESPKRIKQDDGVASDPVVYVTFKHVDWHGTNRPGVQSAVQTLSYSPKSSRFAAS